MQLQQLNIMPEIIELLEKDKVVNAAAFSSYLDSRAEVTTAEVAASCYSIYRAYIYL